jgi:tetratricopeptide (TPR) repeat protein
MQASLSRLPTPGAPSDPGSLVLTTAELPRARGLRYHVLRPHDRGGIGEVFVALDEELNREVALKQMQEQHAGDPHSRGRFVREAEITGGLEHPGIVSVYGLGQYADGRPYYAMRFIKGETLKDAIARFHRDGEGGARSREFELRALLARFVAVCNTLAYAHSRGVIHRDIKPANIMLGQYGETLVVDWGLAKPLAEEGGAPDTPTGRSLVPRQADTVQTQAGSAMGTPSYMSPEQAEGRLDLLGAASDNYSLGATLYTLLTGRPAIEGKDTAEVLRKVQKGEWLPVRQVKPDVPPALAAICQKAMALEPAARYATALKLAADVEHWLADEPVAVYRDPLVVRLGRWARKHRTAVAVGAAVLQTVVVVLAVSVVLIARSRAQIEHERAQAERQRARAEAVNSFLVNDLLAQADPKTNPAGATLTVRELLDRAAGAIGKSAALAANPEVEGGVRSAIGNTYYGLGLYQRAREELERAVVCQDQSPDVPAAERIFTKNRLCWVIYKLGSFNETMARQVLAEARAQLGPDHEETVYAADNLATITLGNGNREGFKLYRENLTILERLHGPDHPLTVRAALSLADGLMSNQQGDTPGNLDEALRVMLACRDAAQRAFGPDDPEGLFYENALGFLYARKGQPAEARQVLVPLEKRFVKILGPDHIDMALYHENRALAEEESGHLDIAEAHLRKAHPLRKKQLGDGHGLTRRAAMYLGRVCLAQGKTDEAVAWLRVLLTAGVVRNGGIARTGDPSQERPGLADMSLLGEALAGKGDVDTGVKLLNELQRTLEWLAWRSDWLRAHVSALRYEFSTRIEGVPEKQISWSFKEAIGATNETLRIMKANPTTPPRILAETRARLKRLTEEDAKRPPIR